MLKTIRKMTRWQLAGAGAFVLLASQAVLPWVAQDVFAGSLTNTYVRLSRLSATSPADVRLVFETAGAGATSVSVAFGGSWTGLAASPTPSSASCAADTGATALPGSLTGAGSGGTLTISGVTALSATTSYCVDVPGAVTALPSAGQYTATVTAGSDSTSVGLDVLSSGADQIGVSATVNPSFTFSLSSNSSSLGALSSSTRTAGTAINATVSTNAAAGWQVWGADNTGTPGLHSTAANKTIAYNPTAGSAAATLTAGAEGYNLGVGTPGTGTCNGSPSANANFAGANGSFTGGGLDGTLRALASASGTASSCATPLTVNASISGSTPAANDYADTITVVAAGVF